MQRAVPKTHDKAMENLDQKLEAKQEAIKKAEKELKHAKKVPNLPFYTIPFIHFNEGPTHIIIMSIASSSPSFHYRRLRMEVTGQNTIKRRKQFKSEFLCDLESFVVL